jgi:hypothetical protein
MFGNNDQDDNENLEVNRFDDDLDYLYGEKPERPIYASRSSLSSEPLKESYQESYDNRAVRTDVSQLLDKECQIETQSGFMLVFKGLKDKATLSIRRKVGTPPSSAVTLTPDELRRLSNLVGELTPEPASRQRLAVGDERPPAVSEFDSFVEREYPELAQKRRVKKAFPVTVPEALFELVTEKKMLLGVAAGLTILVVSAVVTSNLLTSKPFSAQPIAVSETKAGSQGTLALEEMSRAFVLDMLNFRKDSYRQAQVRAMAMMTSDLADRYWNETHFPLTARQLRTMPQDQELRIESITPTTISPGNYQVDVKGNLIGASGTAPTPVVIRLSIVQDTTGKLLVAEQKDITAQSKIEAPGTTIDTSTTDGVDSSAAVNGTTTASPAAPVDSAATVNSTPTTAPALTESTASTSNASATPSSSVAAVQNLARSTNSSNGTASVGANQSTSAPVPTRSAAAAMPATAPAIGSEPATDDMPATAPAIHGQTNE